MDNDEVHWTERVVPAAQEYLAAQAQILEGPGEGWLFEAAVARAVAAEERLLYGLVRDLLTQPGNFPCCIEDHIGCLGRYIRRAGNIPADWPAMEEGPGT